MLDLHTQAALLWVHGAGSAWCHHSHDCLLCWATSLCSACSYMTSHTPLRGKCHIWWHFFISAWALEITVMAPSFIQHQQMLFFISSYFYSDVISVWWSATLAVAILSRVESVRWLRRLESTLLLWSHSFCTFCYITSIQGALLLRCARHSTMPSLLPNAVSPGHTPGGSQSWGE